MVGHYSGPLPSFPCLFLNLLLVSVRQNFVQGGPGSDRPLLCHVLKQQQLICRPLTYYCQFSHDDDDSAVVSVAVQLTTHSLKSGDLSKPSVIGLVNLSHPEDLSLSVILHRSFTNILSKAGSIVALQETALLKFLQCDLPFILDYFPLSFKE